MGTIVGTIQKPEHHLKTKHIQPSKTQTHLGPQCVDRGLKMLVTSLMKDHLPSSQETQRSPRVRKQATECLKLN